MTKQQKVAIILERLLAVWPEPKTELTYTTPFELLVAVILSAQNTDKVVNTVTPGLFARYPSLEAYAQASLDDLDSAIKKINYHRTKAKYIQGAAQAILIRFHGQVPDTLADLITLPGVGRKTANVVLADAFNKQEGVIVDTHVIRLSRCFGLTRHTDPIKIEQDLMEIVPPDQWRNFSHVLVLFGRYYCPARKQCSTCPMIGDLAA